MSGLRIPAVAVVILAVSLSPAFACKKADKMLNAVEVSIITNGAHGGDKAWAYKQAEKAAKRAEKNCSDRPAFVDFVRAHSLLAAVNHLIFPRKQIGAAKAREWIASVRGMAKKHGAALTPFQHSILAIMADLSEARAIRSGSASAEAKKLARKYYDEALARMPSTKGAAEYVWMVEMERSQFTDALRL